METISFVIDRNKGYGGKIALKKKCPHGTDFPPSNACDCLCKLVRQISAYSRSFDRPFINSKITKAFCASRDLHKTGQCF